MKNFDAEIERLKKQCLKAFKKTSPPGENEIVESPDERTPQLIIDFANKEWWTINNGIIDEHYAKLCLLTAEAYHYFFPAYLLFALNDFSKYNDVLQFVLYEVTPLDINSKTIRDSKLLEWFEERKSYFSNEEKKVVYDFLNLILMDNEMKIFHKDAKGGLKFWEAKFL